MRRLWEKYREIIMYLIFGVLTTVVSFATYFTILAVAEKVFAVASDSAAYNAVRVVAQVLQWVFAVLFAYYTNKRFVFRAEGGHAVGQMAGFFTARLFSLGIDSLVTFGTIFLLGLAGYKTVVLTVLSISIRLTSDLWAKIAASVVVIILNYVLSKFIVFKKAKSAPNDGQDE